MAQKDYTAKPKELVYKAIVAYKQANDGNSPTQLELAEATGLPPTTLVNQLQKLEADGRIIADGRRSIIVTGGRWSLEDEDEAPPRLFADQASDLRAALAAVDDIDQLRKIAYHHARAAELHMSQNERYRRKLAELHSRLDVYERDPAIRKKNLEIAQLRHEVARLKTELEHATDAWQTYQNRAHSTAQLFHYSKWAAAKLAALQAAHQHKITPVTFGPARTLPAG